MTFDELLADAEAESTAALSRSRLVRLRKRFKDSVQILRGDTGTRIRYADKNVTALARCLDDNAASLRIAGRIAHQVENHLADTGSVAVNLGEIVINADLQSECFPFNQRTHHHHHRISYIVSQIGPFPMQSQPACIGLAEIQDIADHAGQMIAVALYDLQNLHEQGWQRFPIGFRYLQHRVNQTQNYIQRRPKFVADLGHKGGLGLMSFLSNLT